MAVLSILWGEFVAGRLDGLGKTRQVFTEVKNGQACSPLA
jgi:hypothetical protein